MATITPRPKSTKRMIARKPTAKAPLSNARLRKLAKKHRPPQKWYDENVNPFEQRK